MAVGDRVLIRDADFRLVKTSRNLRGILEYSRAHAVERVDIYRNKKDVGGQLGLVWYDGATCITDFASYGVLVNWVAKRRVFQRARIVNHGAEVAS